MSFHIQSKQDRPIIFRTMTRDVYNSTYKNGSIWVRSEKYYQDIEDLARKDAAEGINGTRTIIPLKFNNGVPIEIRGDGVIGQYIVPHYIISFHGTSISEMEQYKFGGCTLGIKCFASLAAEILYEVSKMVFATGYRYGPVSYMHTSLTLSQFPNGAAMNIPGNPPLFLKSIDTDVLRKYPVRPFIEQDEWRIVIFTKEYYKNDPMEPLKINVDPSHFYEYLPPSC